MALHAIQVSSSKEMLTQIRDHKRSRAWNFLKRIANPTLDFDIELLTPKISYPVSLRSMVNRLTPLRFMYYLFRSIKF